MDSMTLFVGWIAGLFTGLGFWAWSAWLSKAEEEDAEERAYRRFRREADERIIRPRPLRVVDTE